MFQPLGPPRLIWWLGWLPGLYRCNPFAWARMLIWLPTWSRGLSAQTTQDFKAVSTRSRELGVDALDNAQPFMGALGDYDERTRPADWPERVLKTYLGMGLLGDFAAHAVSLLPPALASELAPYLDHRELDAFASASILGAAGSDPQLAARLGLWGRRVVGEEVGTFHALLARFKGLAADDAARQGYHDALSAGAATRMKGLGLRV